MPGADWWGTSKPTVQVHHAHHGCCKTVVSAANTPLRATASQKDQNKSKNVSVQVAVMTSTLTATKVATDQDQCRTCQGSLPPSNPGQARLGVTKHDRLCVGRRQNYQASFAARSTYQVVLFDTKVTFGCAVFEAHTSKIITHY